MVAIWGMAKVTPECNAYHFLRGRQQLQQLRGGVEVGRRGRACRDMFAMVVEGLGGGRPEGLGPRGDVGHLGQGVVWREVGAGYK